MLYVVVGFVVVALPVVVVLLLLLAVAALLHCPVPAQRHTAHPLSGDSSCWRNASSSITDSSTSQTEAIIRTFDAMKGEHVQTLQIVGVM